MAHRSNDEEGQSAPHHRVRVPRDMVLERRGAADSVTRSRWRRGVCCVGRSGTRRHGGSCSGSALPWAWPYCYSGGGVGIWFVIKPVNVATGLASRVPLEDVGTIMMDKAFSFTIQLSVSRFRRQDLERKGERTGIVAMLVAAAAASDSCPFATHVRTPPPIGLPQLRAPASSPARRRRPLPPHQARWGPRTGRSGRGCQRR